MVVVLLISALQTFQLKLVVKLRRVALGAGTSFGIEEGGRRVAHDAAQSVEVWLRLLTF